MPRQASHPCAHPGCAALVPPGSRYCTTHQALHRKQYDARRGTAAERGYGKEWRTIRRSFLAINPICQRCRRAKATVAHHIVEKKDGGSDEPINLQALCAMCHAQIHAQRGGLFGGRARKRKVSLY